MFKFLEIICVFLLVINLSNFSQGTQPQSELTTPKEVYEMLQATFLQLGKKERNLRNSSDLKYDIVFVVDNSGQVNQTDFDIEKKILTDLMEYFAVFPAKTRIAIVSVSNSRKITLEFNFKESSNIECVRKGIEKMRYAGVSFTDTLPGETALEYINGTLIFNSDQGAREQAKKIIFVLTVGKSKTEIGLSSAEEILKEKSVEFYVLHVSQRIPNSKTFVNDPNYSYRLKSLDDLNDLSKLVEKDISYRCISGEKIYDVCGRKCECQNGRLVNCCRMRKEFTAMTYNERVHYIEVVKRVSTDPGYHESYEELISIHRDLFHYDIHTYKIFLPWHRWYILKYENFLREVDCGVTVPYWDWSRVGGEPFTSDFWNEGPQGFGGNGLNSSNYCVTTGPFRKGEWSLVDSAEGGCLQRGFNGNDPNTLDVAGLYKNYTDKQFFGFERSLRIRFHDTVHCTIGGTMCRINAASAPEFFLHHAFIDQIWRVWQKMGNQTERNWYFLNQGGEMCGTQVPSRDMVHLDNQPGCVCAHYVVREDRISKDIAGWSLIQLEQIPRVPEQPIPVAAIKLFRIPQSELKMLSLPMPNIKPIQKSALHGIDAVRGFNLSALFQIEKGIKVRKSKTESKSEEEKGE